MLDPQHDRQGFLGRALPAIAEQTRIAIVGLSGGGSHIAQQLAHVGFARHRLFDPKAMEEKHRHRVVGATADDIERGTPKVEIAARVMRSLRPDAVVEAHPCRWQERPEALRGCDLIFGCVDTFADRRELEVCARRFLIPYIDIGLDVFEVDGQPPRMAGQVILSMPGCPCMSCLGFLNDNVLAREGRTYGALGGRPQVVWANGVLASTAVGVAIDLLTDWTRSLRAPVFLEYDGNLQTLRPDVRLRFRGTQECGHYDEQLVGEPVFRLQ